MRILRPACIHSVKREALNKQHLIKQSSVIEDICCCWIGPWTALHSSYVDIYVLDAQHQAEQWWEKKGGRATPRGAFASFEDQAHERLGGCCWQVRTSFISRCSEASREMRIDNASRHHNQPDKAITVEVNRKPQSHSPAANSLSPLPVLHPPAPPSNMLLVWLMLTLSLKIKCVMESKQSCPGWAIPKMAIWLSYYMIQIQIACFPSHPPSPQKDLRN